ncbi:hypothetical protein ABPG74_007061 [Tetrahymena malaccensis]
MSEKYEGYYKQISQSFFARSLKLKGWLDLLNQIKNINKLYDIIEIKDNKQSILITQQETHDNKIKKSALNIQIIFGQQKQSQNTRYNEESLKYFYGVISCNYIVINDIQMKVEEYQYYKYDLNTYLNTLRQNNQEVEKEVNKKFVSQLTQIFDFLEQNGYPLIQLTTSNVLICEDNTILFREEFDLKGQKFYSNEQQLKTNKDQFSFLISISLLMLDNLHSFHFESYKKSEIVKMIENFKQGVIPNYLNINQHSIEFKIAMFLFTQIGKSSPQHTSFVDEIKNIKINFEENQENLKSPPLLNRNQSSTNNKSQKTLCTESENLIAKKSKSVDSKNISAFLSNKYQTTKHSYFEQNVNEQYYQSSHPSLIRLKNECSKKKLTQLDINLQFKCCDKKICFLEFSPIDQSNCISQITKNQIDLQTLSLKSSRTLFTSQHLKIIIDSLNTFNQKLANLDLDLDNAFQLDKNIFYYLTNICKKIKCLRLKLRNSYFCNQDLNSLKSLLDYSEKIEKLELDLSGSIQICDLDMQTILDGFKRFNKNLKELVLKFSQNNNMKSSAFERFNIVTTQMSQLTKLHLDFSFNDHFDNQFLEKISSCILQNIQLQDLYLNLNSNTHIQDQAFSTLIDNLHFCQNLLAIELLFNSNNLITDTSFQNVFQISKCLKKFKLQLSKNKQITDIFLNYIGKLIKDNANLEVFQLVCSENENFTLSGISDLTQSFQNKNENSSSLKEIYLDFAKCLNSDNKWACSIFKNVSFCSELEKININLNLKQNIDDSSFNLFSECLKSQQLKELALTFSQSLFINDPFSDIEIQQCSFDKLQILSLNFEQSQIINDQTLIYIGKIISQMELPKKIELIFTNNKEFTDQGIKALFENSKFENNSLEELVINFQKANKITDEGLISLLKNFEKQDNLKRLMLNFNSSSNISDLFLQQIVISCYLSAYLEQIELSFSNSKFTQNGIQYLSKFLHQQKQLTKLNLNFSQQLNLSQSCYFYLKNSFPQNQNLTELNLNLSDQHELNDSGFISLCCGIGQVSSIQNLVINLEQNNLLTNKSLKYLSDALMKCQFLRLLDLNMDKNDQIDSQGLIYISKGIEKAKYINYLSISIAFNTKIRGEHILCIAQALKNKKQLQELKLNLRKVQGYLSQQSSEFSNCMKTLESLQILHLEFNSISCADNKFLDNLKLGLKECRLQKDILLDFQNSQINPAGIQEFSKIYEHQKNLKSFRAYFSGQLEDLKTTEVYIKSIITKNNQGVKIQLDTQRQFAATDKN